MISSSIIAKPFSHRPYFMLCGDWSVFCPWSIMTEFQNSSIQRGQNKKVLLFLFENEQLRIFLKNFSKKCLTETKNRCIMCLLPPNRGNETKTSKNQNWASESGKENQGQRKKVQKSAWQSFRTLIKCGHTNEGTQVPSNNKRGWHSPSPKPDENANRQQRWDKDWQNQ